MITRRDKFAAAPDDDDWERQIAAAREFFDLVQRVLTPDEFQRLQSRGLNAATIKMLDEAVRLLWDEVD